jgi:hypothetical protein
MPFKPTRPYRATRNWLASPNSRNKMAASKPPTRPTRISTRTKVSSKPLAQEARQPGTHAHGKQVGADDRRELGDRVAQQVAGQRAGDQFVDQPAAGDDQRGEQQQGLHTGLAVDGGRDDQRQADGHGADQDCQRGILLFVDLAPQVIGREPS